jgi:hypothetical protein
VNVPLSPVEVTLLNFGEHKVILEGSERPVALHKRRNQEDGNFIVTIIEVLAMKNVYGSMQQFEAYIHAARATPAQRQQQQQLPRVQSSSPANLRGLPPITDTVLAPRTIELLGFITGILIPTTENERTYTSKYNAAQLLKQMEIIPLFSAQLKQRMTSKETLVQGTVAGARRLN